MLLKHAQSSLVPGFHEVMYQRRHGSERHALAFLAGGKTKCERGVRLAGAAWSQRNDIAPLLDPFPARQFQNHCLVERWLGGEVKGVEAFGVRELGHANTALDHPALAIDLLQFAYPFGRLGIGMPVWKQGSFASETFLSNEMDNLFMIVDTASQPGMSGSPVIQRVHGQVELEDGHGRISSGDGACNFIGIYSGRFDTNEATDAQLGRMWPAILVEEVVAAAMRAHAERQQ